MTRWREADAKKAALTTQRFAEPVRKIRESFRFAPETKDAVSQRFAPSRLR